MWPTLTLTALRCKRGDPETEALGRSRGGFSTKVHVRAEGQGKPVVFVLTGGERHDQVALPALTHRGAIKRVGRGRPRLRPHRLVGDKGYSSRRVRQDLRRRGIGYVTPRKVNVVSQAA